MNKRGSVQDAIYVPMYLLGAAITAFIGMYIWLSFRGGMESVLALTPTSYYQTIVDAMDGIQVGFQAFDYMFPFLVVGMLVVSLIFAYRTGASVLYAFVSLLFWGFAMMLSVIFSNIFGQFETSFPSVSATFTIIPYVMNSMKWIVLAWLFLISTVMFTRTKKEDQALAAAEMAYG